MPSLRTILDQLALASNRMVGVAIAWHAASAAAALALMLGWRPSNRAAGAMLAGPIASAAVVAFAFGNPFNGSVLAALALALVLLSLRLLGGPVARGSAVATAAGVLLLGFGTFYPHFIDGGTPLVYVYAAPTGIIPCPTLSLVIGFALLAGGLTSRAWSLTLAAVGLFYGLFGVARLGVYLDIPLICGATALVIVVLAPFGSAPLPAPGPIWVDRAERVRNP